YLVKKALERVREECDLVIDTSSNAPTKADVVYVHYPANLSSCRRDLVWRAYDLAVEMLVKSTMGYPRLVLCNSTWTMRKFVEVFGRGYRVGVLHPPVDTDYFRDVCAKENLVVTVSRFTPEKNLEKLVDVAKIIPYMEFIIVGSASKYSHSSSVIEKIKRRAEELDVKNLRLVVNAPREELRELLCRAKVYLHPPFPEHFGIAVAEAMASGAVPVVYRDGGAWTDLVSLVDERLGYRDITEIPEILRLVESEADVLRKKSRQIAEKYSQRAFKKKLLDYLADLLST
ncbi:MAG: glycosyltransferase, partial [Desulfurococcaceae archaeon]